METLKRKLWHLIRVVSLGNQTQGRGRLERQLEDSNFFEPEMYAISSAVVLELGKAVRA